MTKPYLPPSKFLLSVKDDQAAFSDDPIGRKNLKKLIALTEDGNRANRDWAVLLLSELDVNTAPVRAALLKAAGDADDAVRSEAIRGLALRDRSLALPLVREALSSRMVYAPVLEAAEIVADAALVENLRSFLAPSDNPYLDRLAQRAFLACGGRSKSADTEIRGDDT